MGGTFQRDTLAGVSRGHSCVDIDPTISLSHTHTRAPLNLPASRVRPYGLRGSRRCHRHRRGSGAGEALGCVTCVAAPSGPADATRMSLRTRFQADSADRAFGKRTRADESRSSAEGPSGGKVGARRGAVTQSFAEELL